MTRGCGPGMAGYDREIPASHDFQAGLSIERKAARLYFNNKR